MKRVLIYISTIFFIAGCAHEIKNNNSNNDYISLSKPKILQRKYCGVSKILFSPDGKLISYGRNVCIWDIKERKVLKYFSILCSGFSVSHNGKYLALGLKTKAVLLNIKTGKIEKTFPGHWDWVEECAFHPDGNILATGDDKAKIRLWDIDTGQNITTITVPQRFSNLQFNPEGTLLLCGTTGADNNNVYIWDFNKKKLESSIPTPGYNNDVSIYEKNKHITIVNSVSYKNTKSWPPYINEVSIYSIFNFKVLKKLIVVDPDKRGFTEIIQSISIHPSGKIFAAGTQRGTLSIFYMDNGKNIYKYTTKKLYPNSQVSIHSVAFSPNGKYLAAGTDRGIIIWGINN